LAIAAGGSYVSRPFKEPIMVVRCKMRLDSIHDFGRSREFNFSLVHDDGTPENKKFYNSSPSGGFKILVNNQEVWGAYKIGSYYYFDSIPVPEPVAVP
jgi:hypothetical protein